MALFEIGSAADEVAADAAGRRDPVAAQRSPTPDHLLEAIRRGLRPADPVGQLLATWRLAPPTG